MADSEFLELKMSMEPNQPQRVTDSFDRRGKEFELLMSEKEQADMQIGAYLGLQVKIHTVIFTGGAVGAGWIFSKSEGALATPEVRAISALVLAFLANFAILQSVVHYGIVLGYIRYKQKVIGKSLATLLELPENPLRAFQTIVSTGSNRVVAVASTSSGLVLVGGSAGLIAYAYAKWLDLEVLNTVFGIALFASFGIWLLATGSALALTYVMRRLERDA